MKISFKNIWNITFPVLLSIMVEQFISMTDTAFLGRLGEVELGASALAATYYFIFYVIGSGFGVGAQILMARMNGEKSYHQINSIFLTSGIFLVGLAAFIILLSKIFSPIILKWFISADDIYSAKISYLDWRIYGLFFSFTMVIFRSLFIAVTHTRILTVSSIIMVLVNIICNYTLIFGKFGFPHLGIAGAAIGSTVMASRRLCRCSSVISAVWICSASIWIWLSSFFLHHRRIADIFPDCIDLFVHFRDAFAQTVIFLAVIFQMIAIYWRR